MDGSGRRLWPRADLRTSDADRQAVVAELQRHYIDGRLTSEELGERVEQTLHARTFADLAVPLADLPILPEPANTEPGALPSGTAPAHDEWWSGGPPIGALLVVVGLLAMLFIFALPMGHFGIFPFWPILIWGFFFVGRPYRGGRRRF
jgi:hypothetical protein